MIINNNFRPHFTLGEVTKQTISKIIKNMEKIHWVQQYC